MMVNKEKYPEKNSVKVDKKSSEEGRHFSIKYLFSNVSLPSFYRTSFSVAMLSL